ncbi:uncharacterized protein LOC123876151 [Maniola jurtina]|uniref:uncharacterized protein LOC123876151 n=1 Tax=Maniola jurtina TaxID=191418 RepID=UPI001E68733B|nr:uncharacterized protein LOC123876151 [Maniola jurtina]
MGNINSEEEYMVNSEEPKARKDSLNVRRLRKAIKLSENLTFQTKFFKLSKLLTKKRIKKVTELTNKRTFSDREKLIALGLYKKNPRVYRLLSKIIVIPPCHVLHKLTSKVGRETGLNKKVYSKLKRRVQRMAQTERLCSLLFDEVTISPTLNRKERQDVLVNNKNKKIKSDLANHTIVFMIRLIFKKQNQPIAYKFSCQRISKDELKIIIRNIISDLQGCGLNVMATICDQDTRNIGAIDKLIMETKEEYLRKKKKYAKDTFEVNGNEIVPLFDAPHLMKGIRNDLVTKNLKGTLKNTVKIAKWDHILQFFMSISKSKFTNVTKYHVIPKKINKTEASYAIQTLSCKHFAGLMEFSAKLGPLPREALDTVYIIAFFDTLFKSMNGSYYQWEEYKEDEPLLGPVTPKRVHEKEWAKSRIVLNSMKFITDDGKEVSTPTLDCWIRTLDNIKHLSRKLFVKHNVKGFWMSQLNMDPLVKFVKRIQKYGCRNVNTYRLK